MAKPYPKKQFMDIESIDWLEKHLNVKISIDDVKRIFKKMKKFPINALDFDKKFYQKNNCFGIHGIRHQFRVSLYIWIIIQYYNVNMVSNDVIQLLQASLYHDILRKNDNADLNHGKRSAIWIKKKYSDINFEIVNAVSNHNANIKTNTIYDVLLKTADALDRYRFPKEKWWINSKYLLMNIDEEILEICKFITFFIEKETCNINDFDRLIGEIISCIRKLNLI